MIATGWWAGPFIEVENDRVLTHPTPSPWCASLPGQRSQSYVSLKGFHAALPTEGRVQGKRLRSNRWVETWEKRTSRRAQGGRVRMSGWKMHAGVRWAGRLIVLTIPMVVIILVCDATVSQAQLDRLRQSKSFTTTPPPESPMVEIPAGEFVMGSDGTQALEDERPSHRVWLDEFSIDLHEVTTAQYAAFLATGRRA